jgi:hypothetical protein
MATRRSNPGAAAAAGAATAVWQAIKWAVRKAAMAWRHDALAASLKPARHERRSFMNGAGPRQIRARFGAASKAGIRLGGAVAMAWMGKGLLGCWRGYVARSRICSWICWPGRKCPAVSRPRLRRWRSRVGDVGSFRLVRENESGARAAGPGRKCRALTTAPAEMEIRLPGGAPGGIGWDALVGHRRAHP